MKLSKYCAQHKDLHHPYPHHHHQLNKIYLLDYRSQMTVHYRQEFCIQDLPWSACIAAQEGS